MVINIPIVSICCLTYNHEPYIRQCLDGFMMQKTDFPLEILIHDDASTDKTADIIKEYEAKYPNIIKPIYQTENQYSKGIKISASYNFPRAQGKYIALCEGDDYWTDSNKLQKQVDFLEANDDVSMCFHNANMINTEGNKIGDHKRYHSDQYVPVEDIIWGGGIFCPTASIIFRTQYVKSGYPDFCLNCHVGDYPLQLYLSVRGKVYYFDSEMSVYRRGMPGSWSQAFLKKDISLKMDNWMSEFKMLDGINALFDYKYASAIAKRQEIFLCDILSQNINEKSKIRKKFKTYISKFSIKGKIKIFLIYHALFFYRRFFEILFRVRHLAKKSNT